MIQLRSMVFFLCWSTMTILFCTLCTPCLLNRSATWWVNRTWVDMSFFLLRLTCHIRSRAEGTEHVRGAMLIGAKHQSAWDTMMLLKLLREPVFVLKRELYRIPFFGWYLWRSGQIAIDRNAGRQAIAQIQKQAAHYHAQGRPIVMFPEGTRGRPGEKKTYHAGIARLSAALQLPVVPAALNAGLFWPKHTKLKFPGTAIIRFLPAVAACADDKQGWLQQLETIIEKESTALLPELPAAAE